MDPLTVLLPVLYAIFLWWFTTGLVIAVYKRSQLVITLSFVLATVLLLASLVGVVATRNHTDPLGVYLAITFGMVIWGWQTTSYYLGFVTGPGHAETVDMADVAPEGWEENLGERVKLALRFIAHHELVVVAIGALLAVITWNAPNRWSLWIYVALWLMHFSAKVNVFLGVRNFSVDVLPRQLHYLKQLLTERTNNCTAFPVSMVLANSICLVVIYQGIAPSATPAQQTGFLFVGTMIVMGVIEHWMMVLPLPATLIGFAMVPTAPAPGPLVYAAIAEQLQTTGGSASASRHSKTPNLRTHTFTRPIGPFVVDVWDAQQQLGKPPIMLVHGWGNSGSYWRSTAWELSQTAQVIVPDLPGTGRSQPVSNPQNMYDQVRSLEWLLDRLELDKVQLVGHSMGGAMSLLLTERQPERIERLNLTSLGFFMTHGQEQIYNVAMSAFRVALGFRPRWLLDVPYLPQMMAMRYFYRVPQDEAVLRQGLDEYLRLDLETALACAENATDPAIKAAGPKMNLPVMLVVCRQDLNVPLPNAEFTANLIPNCDLRWIEKCGHLPMVEKPDEYLALLNEFLDV